MRSRYGLIALVALSCAAGAGGVSIRATSADSAPVDTMATRLVAVTAASNDGRTTITLKGNGRLVPRTVEEAKDLPPRLLVDLPGVQSGVPGVTYVQAPGVQRIRVAANSVSPLVTRVVLDLKRRLPFQWERRGDELLIVVGQDAETNAGVATTKTETPASPTAQESRDAEASSPWTGATSPSAAPRTDVDTPSTPAANATAPAPSSGTATSTETVPAAPVQKASGKAGAKAPAERARAQVTPASTRAAVDADQQTRPMPSEQMKVPEPKTRPAPSDQMKAPEATRPPQPAGEGAARFTGNPVSLDFQGVDLRAVLRTFAEITGLNLVIDPSVQGTVDVSLRDVPWDQALDIILRANQLGYSVDGTIIRIAPLGKLREEQEERRKLADAQALSGELQMMTRTLSYAKAEEMVPLLTRAALTQRGSIQIDKRTNTLIIRDLPTGLEASRQLIDSLDKGQPQVEIEARIVQTNRNFLRELGFKWGFGAEASQRLANALPLAYPNQVAATGSADVGSLAPSSVIGLVTRSVNGAFNLDVELQAAERLGKVRILSTPRVATQNNVEAEISQGTQIPVQTVANNTVTVQFKDATLTLKVRPQITSANTVIMTVSVENASPDYTRSVNGIPPIDTQRANTQVQVDDGATTVIGGVFVSTERSVSDRVPGIASVPLLGWLFRNNNRTDQSQELLIFLTPRIVKG